eukprot:403367695
MEDNIPRRRKIMMINAILLGCSDVGKTTLIHRHIDKEFSNPLPTLGSDFKIRSGKERDIDYKIKFCDIAGQEKFRKFTEVFIKNKNCLVFVFDLTDLNSFLIIEDYYIKVIMELYGTLDLPMFLVGNKSDLEERRVKQEDILKLGEKYSMYYFETSCKDNLNVDDLFESIKMKTIDYLEKNGQFQEEQEKNQTIVIQRPQVNAIQQRQGNICSC